LAKQTQMKKILSILLGVCFLVSITAAAASAGAVNNYGKDGYNPQGYNKDGYNKQGFDKDGYNKQGFDKDGYNKQGYDKYGYNKQGCDKYGHKKAKHTKGHWEIKHIKHNKDNNHKDDWYTNENAWIWDD
jgi:hypothetical protein